MGYDLLIKNAKICDGSGNASYMGSLGVADGKITAVGKVTGTARREINADGLAVAPGFIDVHTHYDAQITWDPFLSSSCWHGITTVMMGNCGVGVAPCKPSENAKMAWDLVNVEALPYDVLLNGVSWDWESFGDYLASIERRKIALNAAFLVPLSALRFYVMGEAASERAATPQEAAQLAAIFREAMLAGAMGFSLSTQPRHMGYQGRPLASRLAGKEELGALCRVMRDLRRGIIEISTLRKVGVLTEEGLELVVFLAEQSQRPVTWLALSDIPGMAPDANDRMMDRVRPFMKKGLRIPPQVTPRPLKMYYDLRTPSLCGEMPSWKGAFNRPAQEQIEFYRTKAFREAFREDIKARRGTFFNGQWDKVFVTRVYKDHNRPLLNKSIAEVARLQNKDGVDAYLDLGIDESLDLGITVEMVNTNTEIVSKFLSYPDVLFGLSDAGAHVAQHCEAGTTTYLLREWVRNRKLFTLETAVKRITSEPADFLGLKSKGRIAAGMDADLVVFDPAEVKTLPVEWCNDLPGGQARLIERSEGYLHVIIGGEIVLSGNQPQGPMPGKVLRPQPE